MKAKLLIICSLLVILTACNTPTATSPTSVLPSPMDTAISTATATSTPTATSTSSIEPTTQTPISTPIQTPIETTTSTLSQNEPIWRAVFSACPCTEGPAQTDSPGETCVAHIYSIHSDGTNLQKLIEGTRYAQAPVPSPNQRYLAFEDDREEVNVITEENGHGLTTPSHTYLLNLTTKEITSLSDIPFTQCQWFSDNNRLLCFADANLYIAHVNSTALQLTNTAQDSQICAFDIDPDSESIAYIEATPKLSEPRNLNVYLMNANGGNSRLVATLSDTTYCGSIQWAPDGKSILITSSTNSVVAASDIFQVEVETGKAHLIFHSEHQLSTKAQWLANGHSIFFVEYNREQGTNALHLVEKDGTVQTIETTGFDSGVMGDLSPQQTQFMFAQPFLNKNNLGGLYVIDLKSEQQAHILANYQVSFDGITTMAGEK